MQFNLTSESYKLNCTKVGSAAFNFANGLNKRAFTSQTHTCSYTPSCVNTENKININVWVYNETYRAGAFVKGLMDLENV